MWLILAAHPTAKVILLSEIGSAGPYLRLGVVRREKDEFQRRLKEMHVDAVVAGNGGCGLCRDSSYSSTARHMERVARSEGASETTTPPWLAWTGMDRLETVPAMRSGKSAFIVTGDPDRNKELCVPGGGFATVKIALPKAWDRLMAERGYAPLALFRIQTDLMSDAPRPRMWPRPRRRRYPNGGSL